MAEQPAGADAPVTASVVVCAYTLDRWELLVAAVRAAAKQAHDVPGNEVVVVVDHNERLLEQAREELGDTALVVENVHGRGLSGARNTGIEASRGEVVVFLDDDAVPREGWRATLLAPFEESRVMATGGTARPVWRGTRPAWFPEEFDWVVGCSYRGQVTGGHSEMVEVRNPLGCNMAFRRSVFAEVGHFREGIGRVGRHPLGCEETELCIRLRQARPGARIVLVPDAVVEHHVTPDRHRFAYFRQRCYAEGLSKAAVTSQVGRSDGLSSERSYVTQTLPHGVLRGLRSSLLGRSSSDGSRWQGAQQSGAIVTGVLYAAVGYARGRLTRENPVGDIAGSPSPTGRETTDRTQQAGVEAGGG